MSPVTLAPSLASQNPFPQILTPDALTFVADLHERFNPRRLELLQQRQKVAQSIRAGMTPDFLPDTQDVRTSDWKVASAPADLNDRRVEITGPVERKMMINALNSGAKVFMADFEDSLAPSWRNVMEGHLNLMAAVRRELEFVSPEGKEYRLKPEIATLVVRPRGWHLSEKHLLIGGQPVSASLADFGLHFFHNAKEQLRRGSGPYFYLPKLENHREARLWNDVFIRAQESLGIPRGTIRATVLIETILAAFEMEEILHELREHASGLNAGRWDYIFSAIKKFAHVPAMIQPDRSQITMTVPFMRAYTELLVRTCHRRGAHAMGGMAAFVPSRKDAAVNENAFRKVREDKQREARDGFDGTWVAHPDLVPVAREVFDGVLGTRPNQKDRSREEVRISAGELVDLRVPGGTITEAGMMNAISVALQYLESWLRGQGAVAIYNLMEDAATAEIARAGLWQWIRHGASLEDGRKIDERLYRAMQDAELDRLRKENGGKPGSYAVAARLLDHLVLNREFTDFLTLEAYDLLSEP